ncbi:propionyl-CoA synthetase [Pantoea rodasii]|uniref:Propionyl-CoA synthetase n=1 Tax=Pantoea rodasii TaxID=1076549 RepID=A0A2M9W5T9_9GAMM|nr:AMP-binding protein [Pantoea rodasii]ORM65361.1 propionyl-CoA synthetase [Pantoea rodasii]PJZ02917.1 propionyl-CoA synthetase [Pantoea rodasii]
MLGSDVDNTGFNSEFWRQEARRIHWQHPFEQVVERIEPGPRSRWFPEGKTNLCFNALDRHLAQRADRCAIIHRDYRGQTHRGSYRELWQQVNVLSSLMMEWGIRPGDRVLIALPVSPLAAVAMLACARLGAVHVVVYSSITSEALLQRTQACTPALILHHSESRGRELLPNIPMTSISMRVVDTASADFMGQLSTHAAMQIPCVWLASSEPSHLLFTSGTSGTPKGIVRDTGGYAVALLASLHHLFKLDDDEVFFTSADIGWVTGHSYGIYAPLLAGLTTVMCESSPRNAPGQNWWQMIEELGITRMLTIAGAIRLARRQGPPRATLASLRAMYLAGEPLDDATEAWVRQVMAVNCENHYWQTESGWPLLAGQGTALSPVFPRAPEVVNPLNGEACAEGETGMLIFNSTLGPGAMLTVWQDDTQHDQRYWLKRNGQWCYATHDCAVRKGDKIVIQGRMDDVINIGGKRLATTEVENALGGLNEILEVVATRTPHALLGEMVALYVVTEALTSLQQRVLKRQIREKLVERCGRHAIPRYIRFYDTLPKTFSGKYIRRELAS